MKMLQKNYKSTKLWMFHDDSILLILFCLPVVGDSLGESVSIENSTLRVCHNFEIAQDLDIADDAKYCRNSIFDNFKHFDRRMMPTIRMSNTLSCWNIMFSGWPLTIKVSIVLQIFYYTASLLMLLEYFNCSVPLLGICEKLCNG